MNGDFPTSHMPVESDQAERSMEESRLIDMENRDSRGYADTQNSLNEASAAVSDALRRLQHLRNTINEMSTSMPPNERQTSVPNPSVGPSHSAILLSDSTADNSDSEVVSDMQRLRSTIPSRIMERLEEYEASTRLHLANLGSTPSTARRIPSFQRTSIHPNTASILPALASFPPTPPANRAPPLPDLVFPPRRSWLEASLSRRRDAGTDDGSTALGRRVAARAAVSTTDPLDSDLPQLENIILSRTADVTRDLENTANRLAALRAAQLESGAASESVRDIENSMVELAAARAANLDRVMEPNRARVRSNERPRSAGSSRVGGSDAPNTLNLYDDDTFISMFPHRPSAGTRRWRFQVGDSTTSPGTDIHPPALADRWDASASSDVPSAASTITRLSRLLPMPHAVPLPNTNETASSERNALDNISYTVRRRLDADGDEQIHNLNPIDWEENDATDWLMPRVDPTIDQGPNREPRTATRTRPRYAMFSMGSRQSPGPTRTPALNYATNNSIPEPTAVEAQGPRRRRGWARLDADGNEITTDEEDELERSRARSRVRALAQIRSSNTSDQPAMSPIEIGASRRETLIPMTRTSVPNSWDGAGATARVRIRSSRHAMAQAVASHSNGTIQDAHATPTHSWNFSTSRSTFMQVDPLPMPIVDMISQPSVQRKPCLSIVRVDKYASLAGR